MREIKTYGDLLEEIERVKKSIKEVKEGFFYEQGDEFDLELYLIHLEKTKRYNEKRWKLQQKFGLYECEKCGSVHLEIEQQRNLEIRGYDYAVTCKDCGHLVFREVSDLDLKDSLSDDDDTHIKDLI